MIIPIPIASKSDFVDFFFETGSHILQVALYSCYIAKNDLEL